ncbi:hypothetical protein EJ02DRAFT_404367 [Clathrospora elynae]|uniref:C2H2-type domain-containing protein n=1 Tax=Clathrospora elynae TaxID=706981 RepID=A0A6A5SSJ5_9PLEO|nr:hypothetical protein EJ02DRAFT_404367 [Clathrospora elynae]
MRAEAEAAVETTKGLLQDLVVVVSLVRTLTDSFGSASDLYRKLKRKAQPKSSDDEVEPHKRPHRLLHRRRNSVFSPERRRTDYSDSEEELICTSSTQVRAEYDRGYRKLGEPFARVTAQTQLQSQIIQLQQTLLNIHQDLLLSTYMAPSSSHSHLARLIETTRTARAVSIHALNLQYQRMLPPVPPSRLEPPMTIPGAFPPSADRRRSGQGSRSRSSSPGDSAPVKPKPAPKPPVHGTRLFCVYARDLQRNASMPLSDDYKAGGDNTCPFCRAYIATRPGKAWEIIVDSCKGTTDEHPKSTSRTFLVKNRFVIKCHRENGSFACVLCSRFMEADTVCKGVGALMDHMWREHTSEELERDGDIVECQ